MNADSILRVNYGDDPLQALADLVLEQASAELPDLSHRVILVNQAGAIPRLQRRLLDGCARRGVPALIAPTIDTLHSWLQRFAPARAVLTEAGRELMMLEALSEYPALSARTGTWPLVHSVLELFDDLNLSADRFPDDLAALTRRLSHAYGIDDATFAPLNNEAQLVHRLWRAWREQLNELDLIDTSQAMAISLEQSLARLDQIDHIYLVGYVSLNKAERAWAKALLMHDKLSLVVHGQTGARGYHPDSPLTELLDELTVPDAQPSANDGYAHLLDQALGSGDLDLPTRIRRQVSRYPGNPCNERLTIYEARHAEDEACAIDLQVRRWWLDGRRDIGIVTNDRKLARRVRALLERAQLALRDSAGWPLSTTSAATVLERWLETVEQNFAHQPLLDLLRSPFVRIAEPERQRESAARFEHGLVQRFGIAGGLHRYREAALKRRVQLDEHYGTGSADGIGELLALLASAAAPLQRLRTGGAWPAQRYLSALFESIEVLGLPESLRHDQAGSQLLAALEEMRAAAAVNTARFDWSGFRGWLRRNLERGHFRTPAAAFGVELMDFSGSRLRQFDAVIIAGAHRDQLPGGATGPAFFNDAVRHELGLPVSSQARNELFYDFRRLLESAPRVMISLRREQQGEPVVASPWVERLRVFTRLAYGEAPTAHDLTELRAVLKPICRSESGALPEARDYSRVSAPALIPATLSASAYQRLLDCPYQFYACHALALKPFEDIDDDLDKSDYGSRVHLILHAFHTGALGLPGPFDAPLTAVSLPQAQALMQEITDAVFAADERRSFGARAWRYRWQNVIPHYLIWQVERARTWRVHACEWNLTRELDPTAGLTLKGQLDRVDLGASGYAIIDYKTGELPGADEIESGEKIQLPFYALLVDAPVAQALFLKLDDASVDAKPCLDAPALTEAVTRQRDRLLRVYQHLRSGAALPAWGDRLTCERCEMAGLCRKEYWLGGDAGSATPSPAKPVKARRGGLA